MNKQDEYAAQCALITWARLHERQYPGVSLLFAIPQGTMLAGYGEFFINSNGKKVSKATIRGARLKKMGVMAGVSDLFLPVPKHNYHGLFIELKSETGRATNEQINFGILMTKQGYAFAVAKGWEHGTEIIKSYYRGGLMPEYIARKRAAFKDEYADLPF